MAKLLRLESSFLGMAGGGRWLGLWSSSTGVCHEMISSFNDLVVPERDTTEASVYQS